MKKACLIITGLFVLLIVISIAFALLRKNVPIGDRLALVTVKGPILDSQETVDELKEYVKDKSVKAIVLRVDSPGGAVAPSQEIYQEVKKAAAKKKVVVSMGSVAASGGYYISVPASRILANPGTLTGSIGVIMEIPNIEGLMGKIGVKTEVIKAGKHKDMASVFRAMGKEERELLESVLANVHEQFIAAVAEGRKLKPDDLRPIADGRIFTGEQAKAHGLVDELGTVEDAVRIAAEMAGIAGEPEVVTKKDRLSLIGMLRGGFPKELTDMFPTVSIKYQYAP
ncbi:MAG: signal peptide peptidase SppA [Thermodesulfovibrionales bacterium]